MRIAVQQAITKEESLTEKMAEMKQELINMIIQTDVNDLISIEERLNSYQLNITCNF
jgi:hypothetical protein